jgi:hypothetical protein
MTERPPKSGCTGVGCFIMGMVGFVGLPLYVLSVRPMVWLVQGTKWEWACLIYFPIGLLASFCEPANRVMQWYLELWRG